jgi:hypothetical protein
MITGIILAVLLLSFWAMISPTKTAKLELEKKHSCHIIKGF